MFSCKQATFNVGVAFPFADYCVMLKEVFIWCLNPLTPRGDLLVTSPFHIHTDRLVMRTLKLVK